MNWALWGKSIREGRWLLLGCSALMFAYAWVNVWLLPQIKAYQMRKILLSVPEFVQKLFPLPVEVMISSTGRLAACFELPLMQISIAAWAIARGSDAISGEIGRGTMELLLAQPVRRLHLLTTHAVVTILGSAVCCICAWLGIGLGTVTVELDEKVDTLMVIPSAVNLFALGVFIAGATTLFSSLDRYRSRTIGIVVSVLIVESILKLISRYAEDFAWLKYLSMFTAFEPQVVSYHFWPSMAGQVNINPWLLSAQYNGLLIGLGLAGYAAAAAIFCHRDLPAPL